MKENTSLPGRFMHNFGWKIASILLAALVWFIITNYNDPVISVSFYNIPVSLRNTNVITDAGEVFEVLDNTDTIATVTIMANRSIAETFTRDNITATADVNELTGRDTVPIHLSVNKNASDITRLSGSIEDVRLSIEDRKTRTIALTVEATGQLSEGYIVGSVVPTQNLVRISGAASRVDAVETAMAEVDITGFTSDISTEADIRLFDDQGVLIRDSAITQNITSVRVNVDILQAKTVPVRVRPSGIPADGYLLTGQNTTNITSVDIAGEASALSGVSEIVLEGDALDVTGRTEDLRVTMDLKDALPSGVVFADEDADSVTEVTVGIGQATARTLEIAYRQVVLQNQPEDAVYAIDTDGEESFALTLIGLEDALALLQEDNMIFTVDVGEAVALTGEEAPSYLITDLKMQLPEGVSISEAPRITLRRQ